MLSVDYTVLYNYVGCVQLQKYSVLPVRLADAYAWQINDQLVNGQWGMEVRKRCKKRIRYDEQRAEEGGSGGM